MSAPPLRIPISADVSGFQRDMQQTGTIVGTAVRGITSRVIEMNAGWLASQGAAGGATLAFGRMLPVIGQVILGYKAIKAAIDFMSYATGLAQQQIADFNSIAEKANSSGFSTEFFQRITKGGISAAASVDDLTEAMKKFNDVSKDKLGGSDLNQRVSQLSDAGNFKGNTGVAQLSSANTNEDKWRATISLIDQALDKGERLAAIDLTNTAWGPKFADNLRQDSSFLDQMQQRADQISKQKLIDQADVGRAEDLKLRLEEAQKTLQDRWKPIQADIATLGTNYYDSMVEINEALAAGVGYLTQQYQILKSFPDWWAKWVGGSSVWTAFTNATTSAESRKVAEEQRGISSDPKDIGMVAAENALGGGLQNRASIRQSMQQATDIQSKVLGDTSKDPNAKGDTQAQADAVDRAINALRRHAEQTEADAKAVGLGAGALARFRAEAQETAAVQANGGKETADQAAEFKVLQDKAEAAAVALAKARVANDISRGQQTALLSPEDVQIANELKDIYPDVAAALGSVQASALRTNQALSEVSSQISSDLTSGLTDITTGAKTASQGFSDMAASIIRDIESMIVKLYIVGPLMRGLQGIGTGVFGLASTGGAAATSVGSALGFGGLFADGGLISGPGGPRSDSIVARLSPGEFVMNAAATSKFRPMLEAMNTRNLPGFADGGFVGAYPGGESAGAECIGLAS